MNGGNEHKYSNIFGLESDIKSTAFQKHQYVFPALVVKNPRANTGDIKDAGLIPGSGRSPGGRRATHSTILAWRIPWAEESGGLQSMKSQRVRWD